MARLHPALEQALPLLPGDRPIHLLTRHSVRELATNGFADYRLPLTEEGIKMARDWGTRMPRPIAALHSSPVGRCLDTASLLYEGWAGTASPPIAHESSLVEPGCFVEDLRLAGPQFFELGILGFINQYLSEGMDGLLTLEDGVAKLVRYLHRREPPAGEMAIHVTHDTIIAAFLGGLLGWRGLNERDWPWMMEGLWLWFDDGALHWIWRAEPGRLDVARWLD